MYEDPCPHGYIPGSCAECRAARSSGTDSGDELLDRYRDRHQGRTRGELDGRREEIIDRAAELKGYGRLSRAQGGELDELIADQIVVDDLIARHDVAARSELIEQITRTP